MKLLFAVLLPVTLLAQEPDFEGCKDSALVSRMTSCWITECAQKDFDAVELRTLVKEGEFTVKRLEGNTETINYSCPGKISPLQIARNIEGALKKAGYRIIFSGPGDNNAPLVTAQKGAQWIEVQTWEGEPSYYRQIAVKVEQMAQEVKANAEGWAAEIESSGKVAVYGINFETNKSDIKPESEAVLKEILTLLEKQPEWKLRIDGHTDNTGPKAANMALSQRRAAAVMAWLVKNGADKSRLTSQGFGDTQPAAENDTEEGKAKNRRVELTKL